jgi:acyl-CoA thioester hydrolase
MMFKYPVTVEFEDVDSYGIAHHTKLIAYLERARVHFITSSKFDINSLPYGIVLVNMNIEFKIALTMLDKVDVELRVKKIENVRFEWDYKIIKEGKTAVKATIQQVTIDLATKRVIPIPDEFKALLSTILIDQGPG